MRLAVIPGVVALLVCTAQEDDGAAALLAADRAFYEATAADGLEGWLGWFAPDAIVATAQGELRAGPDELRAYYGSLAFPPPGFRWSPEAGELAASGDLGYTVGTWEIRPPGAAPPEGKELPGGRYLTVWKRRPDGAYRVVTDGGGRLDVRTRLDEVDGPPLEWSCVAERFELAESGELAFALATWTARTAAGSEREGKLLIVWKRVAEDAWEVAAEIGFDH